MHYRYLWAKHGPSPYVPSHDNAGCPRPIWSLDERLCRILGRRRTGDATVRSTGIKCSGRDREGDPRGRGGALPRRLGARRSGRFWSPSRTGRQSLPGDRTSRRPTSRHGGTLATGRTRGLRGRSRAPAQNQNPPSRWTPVPAATAKTVTARAKASPPRTKTRTAPAIGWIGWIGHGSSLPDCGSRRLGRQPLRPRRPSPGFRPAFPGLSPGELQHERRQDRRL